VGSYVVIAVRTKSLHGRNMMGKLSDFAFFIFTFGRVVGDVARQSFSLLHSRYCLLYRY
jgi:hypothetical protein